MDRAALAALDGQQLRVKGARKPGISLTAPGVPLFCVEALEPR
jgi:hypothetical protein